MCIITDLEEFTPSFDFSEFLLFNTKSPATPNPTNNGNFTTSSSTESDSFESSNNNNNSKYSDKRRHTSKLAARSRRSNESELFQALGETLPISKTILKSLDKSSILRLTLSDIKTQKALGLFPSFHNGTMYQIPKVGFPEFDSNITNTLGGFIIIISINGDINYVSDDISKSLGLAQCDVMGKSIYDYSHPCDHADVKDLLSIKKGQSKVTPRSGLIRMKCTLTPRGSNVTIRAASNKVIHFTGKLYLNDLDESNNVFIGVGEAIPHPSDFDFSAVNSQSSSSFTTTHSADMKFLNVESSVEKLLGYKPNIMIGQSLFEYQHAEDWESLAPIFKGVYSKGQVQTGKYRFLAKNGGWAWVITQATAIYSNNNNNNSRDPTSIICRHFVISEIQTQEILSSVQIKPESVEQMNKSMKALPVSVPATTKVFAPRTQCMEKEFLLPVGTRNCKQTEEIDLTHLAPVAGNDCIPISIGLFEDLLKPLTSTTNDGANRNFDESVIDFDELSLLNNLAQNTQEPTFIPIDVDEMLRNILGTNDSVEALRNNHNDDKKLEISDSMDMSLLLNLSDELEQFCTDELNKMSSSPTGQRRNTMPQAQLQSIFPSDLGINVESMLRKRKSNGDLPKFTTNSTVFPSIDSSNHIPRKMSRMSAEYSQMTNNNNNGLLSFSGLFPNKSIVVDR